MNMGQDNARRQKGKMGNGLMRKTQGVKRNLQDIGARRLNKVKFRAISIFVHGYGFKFLSLKCFEML
jgi:hypothetical protein